VSTDRQKLMQLQKKLEQERGRIIANRSVLPTDNSLPTQVVRELADIELAARAVAAELARHSPRLGYGSVA
jgi:hypothetical protein